MNIIPSLIQLDFINGVIYVKADCISFATIRDCLREHYGGASPVVRHENHVIFKEHKPLTFSEEEVELSKTVCMCGDDMDKHSTLSEHMPVSVYDYNSFEVITVAEELILKEGWRLEHTSGDKTG